MGVFHGCGRLTSQKLVLPVVQRWPAHAELVSHCLRTFLPSAKFHDSHLLQALGIPSLAHPPNDSLPCIWEGLVHPFGQRSTTGVAQRPHGGRDASIVGEVVLDRRSFLGLRELGFSACVAGWQIKTLLVFTEPALQGILGGVTQLTDCGSDALAQLYIELNCSDSVFVGIHELPPASPSFRPHPRWSILNWRQHTIQLERLIH